MCEELDTMVKNNEERRVKIYTLKWGEIGNSGRAAEKKKGNIMNSELQRHTNDRAVWRGAQISKTMNEENTRHCTMVAEGEENASSTKKQEHNQSVVIRKLLTGENEVNNAQKKRMIRKYLKLNKMINNGFFLPVARYEYSQMHTSAQKPELYNDAQ